MRLEYKLWTYFWQKHAENFLVKELTFIESQRLNHFLEYKEYRLAVRTQD